MIAGIGAITAAGISIHFLREQIASSETQEVRRRARSFAAARARMQLSLSDATHYASGMLVLLKACLDSLGAGPEISAVVAAMPKPALPDAAILSFVAVIEATDDDKFAALVADMISEMQVLDSRVAGLQSERGRLGLLTINSYVLNAAKVYAQASTMFGYARRETDQPPYALDWDAVFSALKLNQLYEELYPRLYAFIQHARERAERATS